MKVKCRLFREGEKSTTGDWVNIPTFLRVLNSEYFKNKLRRKVLIGSSSHERRDKALEALEDKTSIVPVADWLLADGQAGLAMTDCWWDEEKKECWCELTILSTDAGKDIKSLIKDGVNLLPSVVFAVEDQDAHEMRIRDIMGVDLTTDPAFDTTLEIIEDDKESA